MSERGETDAMTDKPRTFFEWLTEYRRKLGEVAGPWMVEDIKAGWYAGRESRNEEIEALNRRIAELEEAQSGYEQDIHEGQLSYIEMKKVLQARIDAGLALAAKIQRRARVDCDPANGKFASQFAGRIEAEIADELRAALSGPADRQPGRKL